MFATALQSSVQKDYCCKYIYIYIYIERKIKTDRQTETEELRESWRNTRKEKG